MQQPEEPDPKAKAQGRRGFRLVDQGSVVELQLVESITQVREILGINREESRIHHWFGVLIAAKIFLRGLGSIGDSVADSGLTDILDAGDEVPDLPHRQPLSRHHFWGYDANLKHLVCCAGTHHKDFLTVAQSTVNDADIRDDTAIRVIDRIKNEGPSRRVGHSLGSWHLSDDGIEQIADALTSLCRNSQHLRLVATNDPGDLGGMTIRLSTRQVDLVEHWNDLQISFQSQIQVG